MQTREEEKRIAKIRKRFVKLHGKGAWMKLNYYAFRLFCGPSRVAGVIGVSVYTTKYWIRKISTQRTIEKHQ